MDEQSRQGTTGLPPPGGGPDGLGAACTLALEPGRFEGRAAFSGLIYQAFYAAAAQGWNEMIICDPDFADWPLGDRDVVLSLGLWARQGRKFSMLATHYEEVQRRHPRFVSWRRTWSHLVECRTTRGSPACEFPSVFWSPAWVVERLDPLQSRGVASAVATRRVALKEHLDEYLLRSTPAFPTTTLGL